MKQTLYDILGVSREASPEEIAVAYQSQLVALEGTQDPTALNLAREAQLSRDKMVLNIGVQGQRLVCDRR